MNAWTVILTAGLGSYLFRLSMIVLFDRITMPAFLERASQLVAPAAFAAMAVAGLATACLGQGTVQVAASLKIATPHHAPISTDRRIGAAESCSGRTSGQAQISQFWVSSAWRALRGPARRRGHSPCWYAPGLLPASMEGASEAALW
jgi:Branched-chain amino acid transport protein (AzlD)